MRRLVVAALVLALLTGVGRLVADYLAPNAGSEAAIRETLLEATPGDTLDGAVREALAADDVALAAQFVTLGTTLGRPVSAETEAALAAETAFAMTVLRNGGDFLGAFVTGEAATGAGLAGAVASDLTVVGDVRDLIGEGGKALAGAEYSEVLLALAATGLAAEGAAIATGGAGLTAKVGVSLLKAAKRSGNLTAGFATTLLGLVRTAGGFGGDGARLTAAGGGRAAVRQTRRAGAPVSGGRGSLRAGEARSVRAAARAQLAAVGADLGAMRRNAGTAETVRLLRHVRTTDDLGGLARFTGRFQDTARAVVRLTGKTTLRAFRTSVRVVRTILTSIMGLVVWLAGLIALAIARRGYAITIALVAAALGAGVRLVGRVVSLPRPLPA